MSSVKPISPRIQTLNTDLGRYAFSEPRQQSCTASCDTSGRTRILTGRARCYLATSMSDLACFEHVPRRVGQRVMGCAPRWGICIPWELRLFSCRPFLRVSLRWLWQLVCLWVASQPGDPLISRHTHASSCPGILKIRLKPWCDQTTSCKYRADTTK